MARSSEAYSGTSHTGGNAARPGDSRQASCCPGGSISSTDRRDATRQVLHQVAKSEEFMARPLFCDQGPRSYPEATPGNNTL